MVGDGEGGEQVEGACESDGEGWCGEGCDGGCDGGAEGLGEEDEAAAACHVFLVVVASREGSGGGGCGDEKVPRLRRGCDGEEGG